MTVRMRDIKALRRELRLHAKQMDERDRLYTERYETQQEALAKAFAAAQAQGRDQREPVHDLLKWLGTLAAVALAWALGKWTK
jgi:hypothetical protein